MTRLITTILIIFSINPANAEIFINKRHGVFLPPVSTQITAGELKWFPLLKANHAPNYSDQYEISVSVNGIFADIKAYICDANNLNLIRNGQNFRCFAAEGNGNFLIKGNRYSDAEHFLVFDNRHSLVTPKNVYANIYAAFEIDEAIRQKLEDNFSSIISELHEFFIAPDFDVTVAPCKEDNAFSWSDGGHITICSELIYGTFLEGNMGAFMGVFLHELGHTLLNIWDNPHFGNEKTADEFAIAILLMDEEQRSEQIIYDFIKYFEDRSYLEAEVIGAISGGQHPLNIQRINNIRNILTNRGEFLRRWANVLYPNMTDSSLNEIINNPYAGANVELAKQILNSR